MRFNPYLEVVIAAIIWGSSGAFIKYLDLPVTTVAFFRVGVPVILLSIFFLIRRTRLLRFNNKIMLFASSLNAIRMFLYVFAFTSTSIGNVVIILYTWPIFATIFSLIILKEKISMRNALLLALAFGGVAIMYLNQEFSFANKDFLGMSSVLLSAMIYSLTVILYKKESHNHSRLEIVFYQNLVGAVVFFPFLFINQPVPSFHQVSVGVIYAFLIGLVGFGLFFSALKRIKASTASFLSYIEVISGVLFGIILFNEVLTWNMAIGGLLIVVATILLRK